VSYNGKTGLKSLEEQQHFEKSFPILVGYVTSSLDPQRNHEDIR
jgi:hypothetical protein